MLKKLLFIALLILPLPGWSASVILVLGDSLSAAYGMEQKDGWVALLEQRLRDQRHDYTVVNASISGETTWGARNRVKSLLEKYRPAIVIIELGGNDGLRGLPLRDMRKNLESIVRASQAQHAQVLLVGMRLPPNYGNAYTEAFQDIYHQIANAHRIALVPFLLDGIGEDRQQFQSDGIHPSSASQSRLLDNVWPHLRLLLHAS